MATKKKWEVNWGAVAAIASVVAIFCSFLVPEAREFFGLEKPAAPVAPSMATNDAPAKPKEAGPPSSASPAVPEEKPAGQKMGRRPATKVVGEHSVPENSVAGNRNVVGEYNRANVPAPAGDQTRQPTPGLSPGPYHITIPSGQSWTPTDIMVEQGQVVTINAEGEIHLAPNDPPRGPDGIGRACYPNPSIRNGNFPAPDLPCYSLIGRLGDQGVPFEVGHYRQFRAQISGRLDLGINTNRFADSSESWSATVSIEDLP